MGVLGLESLLKGFAVVPLQEACVFSRINSAQVAPAELSSQPRAAIDTSRVHFLRRFDTGHTEESVGVGFRHCQPPFALFRKQSDNPCFQDECFDGQVQPGI